MKLAFLAGPVAGIARFVSGVQVTWLDGSPPQDGQYIFFANHSSDLDFFVLWSVLPRSLRERTRPVAAKDHFESRLGAAFGTDVFNAIYVPRHEHEGTAADPAAAGRTIESIADEMGDRYSIVIFPEGTRTPGDEVTPFKSGLYYLCRRKPGVPLVPVYLENLNRILPKGELLPVPFVSRLVVGAPMAFDASASKDDFLSQARGALCALKPA